MIPHCHLNYSYRKTYILCSRISTFNPTDKTKLQRVKIEFTTTRVERGETSYDPSMLTKPMICQDHDISRSRETDRHRERELEREREKERLNT